MNEKRRRSPKLDSFLGKRVEVTEKDNTVWVGFLEFQTPETALHHSEECYSYYLRDAAFRIDGEWQDTRYYKHYFRKSNIRKVREICADAVIAR